MRGPYYRWLFFAAGPLEAATTNRALGFVVPEGREQMAGYGTYADILNALAQALDKLGYLPGDRFTADVHVGSQIGFSMEFRMLGRRPGFDAYWNRLGVRPAAVRAGGIGGALMPVAHPA
ncbi:MAG: hypothetical protein ACREFP_24825 [Acetobacteraceae bacterium]